MRLVEVTVTPQGGALPAGVANAGRRWRRRRGLLLTIRDEAGRIGVGEASPLPDYSPESLGQARRALKLWREAAPARLEIDDGDPLAAARAQTGTIEAAPSARFAVETALLDLAGQRLERPLWSLLAEAPHVSSPSMPSSVPLAGLVSAAEPRAAAAAARGAMARGLRTLKVKVGRPGALAGELETLAAVRAAIGSGIDLRLDANGTLSPATLDADLAALAAACAPSLIEEPVSGDSLGALERSPIALAVDETLQRPDGWRVVERLAARGLCRAVVLKPMALGGALRCLDLARRAADLGVAAYVTHLFDGPVARAAAAHLALALPEVGGDRLACGLDLHPGLDVWPAAAGTDALFAVAEIVPSEAAGLGIAWPDPTGGL